MAVWERKRYAYFSKGRTEKVISPTPILGDLYRAFLPLGQNLFLYAALSIWFIDRDLCAAGYQIFGKEASLEPHNSHSGNGFPFSRGAGCAVYYSRCDSSAGDHRFSHAGLRKMDLRNSHSPYRIF